MALLMTKPITGPASEWLDLFAEQMPGLEVRIWPEVGDPADIEYVLIGRMKLSELPPLPNLKLFLAMYAGIEGFIAPSHLPDVPMVRTGPPGGDIAMTEYVMLHVLRHHRQMPDYLDQQARREWKVRPQKRPHEQRVGFFGYGDLAAPIAAQLADMGFDVAAWARTPRPEAPVPVFAGDDGFRPFLARTDIGVCLLPLTPQTRGILNAATFAQMPRGAAIVNVGRGEHLVEADLIAALDSGQLDAATLDVTAPEPLPPDSPLWTHPRVTILPHVARRVRADSTVPQVVENIRRLRAGEPLNQQVDRAAGY
jgi:glyoxylate/hydroxypyruvate reductase A